MKKDAWNAVERMRKGNIPGLSMALIDHGMLNRQECWGETGLGSGKPIQADTMFNACSISKFAAAMLVLLLVEEGILGLDEDVCGRLVAWKIPEDPLYDSRDITLRRLLSHQAGFADPEGSFGVFSREYGAPTMADLLEGTTYYSPKPAALMAEPGSQFIYSDTGYRILQQLIEDVTGKSFERLMQEKIFEPLHMNHSRIVTSDMDIRPGSASGHNKHGERLQDPYTIYPFPAAAGLWATPSDLALLLIELMNSVHGRGRLVISAETASDMILPQGCFQWTGLGVFLDTSNGQLEISSLGWGVGYQCMLIAHPYTGRGAVLMMNADPGVHQNQSLLGEAASMWRQGQLDKRKIRKTSINVLSQKRS
ncbi:beta-lactamase family protein [Paenibacillus sp. KQZ6P-2]|uniref:Beta-lactamase family protein n=1 Tax=Paenibacillus mangrovi TaxID=2931978 RepID=A0A9X2B2R0_9BACL|nr:serine hydrolase domain-containing protein [Paenibacillus mangrovi]MCJ8012556.1 beta-lactamase family protein [Paenibacillus mangrovi]